MDIDFDSLLKAVKGVAQKLQSYDWAEVIEWIKKRKIVTVREIAHYAKVKHRQLAYQWANRHVFMVVDLDTHKRRIIDPDEFLVKIRKAKSVYFAHKDLVEKAFTKKANSE